MEISVKKEELQKKSLFVATPMYGGMNHGLYAKACLDLQALCMQYGVKIKFSFLFNESLITRARNYLVDEFIHRSDCTHLLFLDSDIHFNPQDVIALLALDKDVIGGPYPKKAIKWRAVKKAMEKNPEIEAQALERVTGDFVFNPVKGTQKFTVTEPLQVLEIGTGFMMVKRHVIEQLIALHPELKYRDNIGIGAQYEPLMYGLFDTMIDKDDNYLSEDWTFCYLWRMAGGKIFADTGIKLDHTGYHKYAGDLDELKKVLTNKIANGVGVGADMNVPKIQLDLNDVGSIEVVDKEAENNE